MGHARGQNPQPSMEGVLKSTPAASLVHRLFPLQAPRLPTLMQSILAESLSAGGETKPQSEIKRQIGPWGNETRTRLG